MADIRGQVDSGDPVPVSDQSFEIEVEPVLDLQARSAGLDERFVGLRNLLVLGVDCILTLHHLPRVVADWRFIMAVLD